MKTLKCLLLGLFTNLFLNSQSLSYCIHPSSSEQDGAILLYNIDELGYDYIWSTGATEAAIGGMSDGIYILTLTSYTDGVPCNSEVQFYVPPCSDYELDFSLSATPVYQDDGSFGGIILSKEI